MLPYIERMKSHKVLIVAGSLLATSLLLIVICPLISHYMLTKYGDDSALLVIVNVFNLLAGAMLLVGIVVLPVGIYRAIKAPSKKH